MLLSLCCCEGDAETSVHDEGAAIVVLSDLRVPDVQMVVEAESFSSGHDPSAAEIPAELNLVEPFFISITKSEVTAPVGCKLAVADNGNVRVHKVVDGPIAEWNLTHHNLRVQPGYRIIEVNGIRGDSSVLVQALKSSCELNILFEPTPANAK
eukprot:NODE_23225_length_675_cov_3.521898.p1 GENE.NODE_23225_length_675_cov_3.521898~~NODE_23225_length_675_cov_3.521898.p1  ORF type:complete len:153 (+),score=26.36 NODE_23225_length_675_cov_3.521898:76-534(+)